MKKFLSSLLFSFVITSVSVGQEQLGLRIDNYAGVNGLMLNPSASLTYPLNWDVNLVGTAHFFGNNYGYIRNTYLLELLKNGQDADFVFGPDYREGGAAPSDAYVLDFFDNNRRRHASLLSEVIGPSLLIKTGETHSFALFSRFRTMLSAQHVPESLSYYTYEDYSYFDEFLIDPFTIAGFSYLELGLNYCFRLPAYNGDWGLGISAKYLRGYDAFYFRNKERFTITKLPGNSFGAEAASVEFGDATTNFEGDGFDYKPEKTGSGIALDIGFTKKVQGNSGEYQWKWGVSLIDIGFIRFNSNAQKHKISFDNSVNISESGFSTISNVHELNKNIRNLSLQAIGDSLASFADSEFTLWLPSALSIQADYAFSEQLYLNATWVQRIPISGNMVKRNNLFALTPRYEHRWFGLSFPLVISNWADYQIGTSLRIAFLTIGSDRISNLFFRSNFSGYDVYLALKLNPLRLNRGLKGNSGKRGKVKCYYF
ncbi:MAG: hypothetical protein GY705_11470 [Bacteroidetes bacterium]|nr:hypothetical protein [Bacteroidota bacterium]